MTVAGSSEHERYEEKILNIVRGFLETVVMVDDQAFTDKSLTNIAAQEKIERKAGRAVSSGLRPPVNEDRSEHDLDPKAITDAFAGAGLICALLEPSATEDESDNFLNAARRADLVVLDWVIHRDPGHKTLALIKRILEEDKKPSNRLRIIAIYTGEKDLRTVAKRLQKQIAGIYPKCQVIEFDDGFTFRCGPVHATVFAKGLVTDLPPELESRRIPIADLPARLQTEFATLTSGLISGVAIAALGALRNETHRLLAAVGADIDGAHLGQRIALHTPSDAEEQAASLVIHEIESIVQDSEVERYANLDSVGQWLDWKDRTSYGPVLSTETFDRAQVDFMLRFGLGSDEGIDGYNSVHALSKDKLRKVKKKAARLFYDEKQVADDANSRLASMMMNVGMYSHPRRFLHLGTVIKSSATGDFLLCMQPLCDSVRLTGARHFPFLPLTESMDAIDVVVSESDRWFQLQLSRDPHRTLMLDFSPNTEQCVSAHRAKGQFIFKSVNNRNYVWIAQMRQEFAQRLAVQFGNQYARVGVDDPEAFRR